jgi:hypothetical protein
MRRLDPRSTGGRSILQRQENRQPAPAGKSGSSHFLRDGDRVPVNVLKGEFLHAVELYPRGPALERYNIGS